jgi:hypothetical protein
MRTNEQACGYPEEDLKFPRSGLEITKIALQLAGDLRSICVRSGCVVHGGVTFG